MDVLIKGMEIPKACGYCFAYDDEYCQCSLEPSYDGHWSRDNHCPLVELPPHGDLIERSKVHEAITQAYCLEDVPSIIDQLVPTVLEAST